MPDDLTTELEAAVDAEGSGHQPDLAWVVQRGSRVRRQRTAMVSAVAVVFLALGVVAVETVRDNVGPRPIPQPIAPATPDVQEPLPGEIVEDVPEQYQAEIFAIRAVDAVGLMTLDGQGFLFRATDETRKTGDDWRVAFSATECDSSTCRGLSGEDPETGNTLTDTWVVVRKTEGRWVVVGADGNIGDDERERLVGYSLPDAREPSHWEAHAVGVRDLGDGLSVQMLPVWIGPFPTTALGSVCSLQPLDGENRPVGEKTSFYREAPTREFDRAGSVHGRELEAAGSAQDAAVDCRQYTGRTWEVASEPELITDRRGVVGIAAELVWRGDEGFTTAARCDGTLLDEDGDVVFEGSGRAEGLWRPGDLKSHPYETTVVITTGGERVDAEEVGDFSCRSI